MYILHCANIKTFLNINEFRSSNKMKTSNKTYIMLIFKVLQSLFRNIINFDIFLYKLVYVKLFLTLHSVIFTLTNYLKFFCEK